MWATWVGLCAPFAWCRGVANPHQYLNPLSSAVCRCCPSGTDALGSPGCPGTVPTLWAGGGTGSSLTSLPSLQRAGVSGGGAGATVQHQRLAEQDREQLCAFPGPRAMRREPGWHAGRTSPCLVMDERVPKLMYIPKRSPPQQQRCAAAPRCLGAAGAWGSCSSGCLCREPRRWAGVPCPRASMLPCSPWSLQLSLG